jgi:hypothetical protein
MFQKPLLDDMFQWKTDFFEGMVNGNFRILNWRYVSTIFLAIFSGDIP